MDVILLLNGYRESIIRDDLDFLLLSLIYRDDYRSDLELCEATATRAPEVRARLRRLFQSGLVTLVEKNAYALTPLAEQSMSGIGIDEEIGPSLIDDVCDARHARSVKRFWHLNYEHSPEGRARSIRSLKNARYYIRSTGKDSEAAQSIILASLLSPNSTLRTAVRNDRLFAGGDGYESEWKSAFDALEASDAALLACQDNVESIHDLPPLARDVTTVRLMNSASHWEEDRLVEETVSRTGVAAIGALVGLIVPAALPLMAVWGPMLLARTGKRDGKSAIDHLVDFLATNAGARTESRPATGTEGARRLVSLAAETASVPATNPETTRIHLELRAKLRAVANSALPDDAKVLARVSDAADHLANLINRGH